MTHRIQNGWQFFCRLTRARVAPVIMAPVLVGSALAWAQTGQFAWGWFLLTLLGAVLAHLASNVINDVFDYVGGADPTAEKTEKSVSTGSGMITTGTMTFNQVRLAAWGLFAAALACGVILAVFRGWPVLLFAVLGFLIAYFYVAPPIRFGYIGRGLGEVGIFIAFGVLPTLGAYYVQAQTITWQAVLATLPVGLYTTSILFNHHFLHWRSDRAVGKMTPVVALGEQRAAIVAILLVVAVYVSILIDVALGVFPLYGILALATIPIMYQALARLARRQDLRSIFRLMGSTFRANILTAVILSASLLIAGFLR